MDQVIQVGSKLGSLKIARPTNVRTILFFPKLTLKLDFSGLQRPDSVFHNILSTEFCYKFDYSILKPYNLLVRLYNQARTSSGGFFILLQFTLSQLEHYCEISSTATIKRILSQFDLSEFVNPQYKSRFRNSFSLIEPMK